MDRRLFLFVLVATAACAPLPLALPAGASAAWFGLGTEPGWSVELTPERLVYVGDYGETRLVVPRPQVTQRGGALRYSGAGLTMTVERLGPCSDGMSARLYADTVTVEVGGRTLRGCGGAVVRASPA